MLLLTSVGVPRHPGSNLEQVHVEAVGAEPGRAGSPGVGGDDLGHNPTVSVSLGALDGDGLTLHPLAQGAAGGFAVGLALSLAPRACHGRHARPSLRTGDDMMAMLGIGRKQPVISHQMRSRTRHEGSQSRNEVQRLEKYVGGPVPKRALERVHHQAIAINAQPLERNRSSRDVTTPALQLALRCSASHTNAALME